ncbi:MAG: (d)CMP kinase [bacterium]|jgi:cytidylate kinase|nr:MAG: (d)CMP kinase [bacterium]
MIIAIDGPAGSGKTTTARAVAQQLGFRHLETGAFYRAITLAALRAGIPPEKWGELTGADLDELGFEVRPDDFGFRFYLGDEDVTDALRSDLVTQRVSDMAAVPAVRAWMLGRIRAAAREADVVADGRDIGTIVFPNADIKIFLTARPEVRARRRLLQRGSAEPTPAAIAAEAERLTERDRKDSERATAPLRRAPDAVVVDTTALTFDQQVERIVGLVVRRSKRP